MRRAWLALALLLPPLGCSSLSAANPALAPRAIFTSAIDDQDKPTDRLTRVSLQQEEVYLWIRWFDLEEGAHRCRWEVSDGSGRVVRVSEMAMDPGDDTTWHRHAMTPALEVPGLWRFRIYVDGRLRSEPSLEVTDR